MCHDTIYLLDLRNDLFVLQASTQGMAASLGQCTSTHGSTAGQDQGNLAASDGGQLAEFHPLQ